MRRGERERGAVVRQRLFERAEAPRPVSGISQRVGGALAIAATSTPGRATVLERLHVVMGEQLGPVLGPVGRQRLDPLGRPQVPVSRSARGSWP